MLKFFDWYFFSSQCRPMVQLIASITIYTLFTKIWRRKTHSLNHRNVFFTIIQSWKVRKSSMEINLLHGSYTLDCMQTNGKNGFFVATFKTLMRIIIIVVFNAFLLFVIYSAASQVGFGIRMVKNRLHPIVRNLIFFSEAPVIMFSSIYFLLYKTEMQTFFYGWRRMEERNDALIKGRMLIRSKEM